MYEKKAPVYIMVAFNSSVMNARTNVEHFLKKAS